ncbi:MAG: glycosyltransferase family 1 protein [Oscillatoriales cyanobacterium]|nr:MAG: glycosyltransferase family 1 protein [Oscillatoriales cyanobacterium]
MKILVLAWEFPPRIVGGIARHVSELYPELVKLGHSIHLITVEFGHAPMYEVVEGIHVHRVVVGHARDFFHWVANLNQSMGHQGGKLMLEEGPFDLIHAHDWLVGDAAIALKHTFKVPLIATIHATEYGRFSGLHNDGQCYINAKENDLAYNAWRVIVCSDYMRREAELVLSTPWNKIEVIYNGIRPEKKPRRDEFDAMDFRRKFAADHEKIVYYVGRISYEKGIAVFLNAAPQVIREMGGNAKIVIVGGGNTDHLKVMAWNLGIFQTVADCAVFPSLYEPFGIVALESFAARVPVVVSNAGGLPEVVQHTKTGVVTEANNRDSLAWGILEVLKNPGYGRWLVDNAYEDLERRFSWPKLAMETEWVYQRVVEERAEVDW